MRLGFNLFGVGVTIIDTEDEQPEAEMLTEMYDGLHTDEARRILVDMASKAGYTLRPDGSFEEEERYYCGLCGCMREISHFPH
jgi:hypothetical protein